MSELESQIRILEKMFPDDAAFGKEVRKIALELRNVDFTKRKEEWDKLKTTKDFLEWEEKRKQK